MRKVPMTVTNFMIDAAYMRPSLVVTESHDFPETDALLLISSQWKQCSSIYWDLIVSARSFLCTVSNQSSVPISVPALSALAWAGFSLSHIYIYMSHNVMLRDVTSLHNILCNITSHHNTVFVTVVQLLP